MDKKNFITVGLIEDNQALRRSIEDFVQLDKELGMLFSCNSIEKWLMHFETDPIAPTILFLDIGLPGISGLKAISILRSKYPLTKLIVISGDSSNESVWEAITSGANGYLLKPFSLMEIRQQINIIQSGGAALSPQIAIKLIQRISAGTTAVDQNETDSLTLREKDVLEQLIKGLSYKEVSNVLKISYATVNDHIKNIYSKLGVNSKSELIVKVLKSKN